jgi:hypothetical protein
MDQTMDHTAMTPEEVEYWTNSMNQQQTPPQPNQMVYHNNGRGGSGGHLEWQYIIFAALIGILTAFGVMYSLFQMIQNVAFEPLTDQEKLEAMSEVDTSELLDSSDGKCVCCRKETQGNGNAWQTTGIGGCGYLTCHECFSTYQPLPERCERCGQFYCYRRERVTFIELLNEEGGGEDNQEKEDHTNNVPKLVVVESQMSQKEDDGLRRRAPVR